MDKAAKDGSIIDVGGVVVDFVFSVFGEVGFDVSKYSSPFLSEGLTMYRPSGRRLNSSLRCSTVRLLGSRFGSMFLVANSWRRYYRTVLTPF